MFVAIEGAKREKNNKKQNGKTRYERRRRRRLWPEDWRLDRSGDGSDGVVVVATATAADFDVSTVLNCAAIDEQSGDYRRALAHANDGDVCATADSNDDDDEPRVLLVVVVVVAVRTNNDRGDGDGGGGDGGDSDDGGSGSARDGDSIGCEQAAALSILCVRGKHFRVSRAARRTKLSSKRSCALEGRAPQLRVVTFLDCMATIWSRSNDSIARPRRNEICAVRRKVAILRARAQIKTCCCGSRSPFTRRADAVKMIILVDASARLSRRKKNVFTSICGRTSACSQSPIVAAAHRARARVNDFARARGIFARNVGEDDDDDR